ncbi:hypothetical protein [Comamonas terrigena]|uniref:hypothetical protein n=1 Tax=Comamonas terrigena TaxID=32013 RepID=UPI0028A03EE6|nr:hypothetical protein [Comamonas terrigena]
MSRHLDRHLGMGLVLRMAAALRGLLRCVGVLLLARLGPLRSGLECHRGHGGGHRLLVAGRVAGGGRNILLPTLDGTRRRGGGVAGGERLRAPAAASDAVVRPEWECRWRKLVVMVF